jgi:threonine dehydrogenase-like Zn-dependent dehydrogenase
MKSTYLYFPSLGRVTVETEEVTSDGLAPLEVLIQNETSVISTGTELARLHGLGEAVFPARPGYGSIGRVLARGSDVTDVEVGARVFYAGKHALVQRFSHRQGHQWGQLFPVPEGDPIELVMGCMAEIAMTAPNVTTLRLGDTVAVFGLGLIGNLAAQMYKLRGARVIGLDPAEKRCELARRTGISEVVSVPADRQVEAVKELTGGQGAHVTVDAVGHSAVIVGAIQATRVFGQVVLVGSPRAPFSTDVTPLLNTVHENGLVVRGAHMWRLPLSEGRGIPESVEWAFSTVFRLIAERELRVRELVSHVIPVEDAPAAYRGLKEQPNEYTGVVIDWRG